MQLPPPGGEHPGILAGDAQRRHFNNNKETSNPHLSGEKVS
jgi:hypothetical protein